MSRAAIGFRGPVVSSWTTSNGQVQCTVRRAMPMPPLRLPPPHPIRVGDPAPAARASQPAASTGTGGDELGSLATAGRVAGPSTRCAQGDPAAWAIASAFARMIAEALSGARPIRQLETIAPDAGLMQLSAIQRRGGLVVLSSTLVRVDRAAPTAIEGAACYRWRRTGPNGGASGHPSREGMITAAFRLVRGRLRWTCSDLQAIDSRIRAIT